MIFNKRFSHTKVETISEDTLDVTAEVGAVEERITKIIKPFFSTDLLFKSDKLYSSNGEIYGASPVVNAGDVGFGAGRYPLEFADPTITVMPCTSMQGTYIPGHPNYGNFIDLNGSIMVYIPKFYFKLSYDNTITVTNGVKVEISFEPKQDFILHRAFINDGQEKNGFFIDKYCNCNINGIPTSYPNRPPIGCSANSFSPISDLNKLNDKTITASVLGALTAAKLRGREYFVASAYMWGALKMLCLAQMVAVNAKQNVNTIYKTKAYTPLNKIPRSNKIMIVSNGYSYSNFSNPYYGFIGADSYNNDAAAYTCSHNGQPNGVMLPSSNVNELMSGLLLARTAGTNSYENLGFYHLKTTADISSLNDTNINDINLFDVFSLNSTNTVTNTGSQKTYTYLKLKENIFNVSTNVNTVGYKNTCAGIANFNQANLSEATLDDDIGFTYGLLTSNQGSKLLALTGGFSYQDVLNANQIDTTLFNIHSVSMDASSFIKIGFRCACYI